MKDILDRLFTLLKRSSWFKKNSALVGAFFLGMLFQENFWREIKGTQTLWGMKPETWHLLVWGIIGVSGVAASIGLTAKTTAADKYAIAQKAFAKDAEKQLDKLDAAADKELAARDKQEAAAP